MDPTKPIDSTQDERAPKLAETLAAEANSSAGVGQARYQALHEIGRGGMGRVIAAKDSQFRRVVAIKELLKQNPRAVERFAAEALITGNLEHPGVASVYERGIKDDGSPFYAMRMIQGKTLAEAISDAPNVEGRLALLPVLVKVAHTLAYAHGKGVIHRDIKPQNIIIGTHGEAIVLDWGIAKIKGTLHTEDLLADTKEELQGSTQYGTAIGTPAYMPPEQAKGQLERIDERTDVFALGAILFHLLTGKRPYEGNAKEALKLAESGSRPVLSNIAPESPKGLQEICNKAMAYSPEERFKSANEMAEALEAFLSRAVLGKESNLERLAVNILLFILTLVLLAGSLVGMLFLPSFREMGGASFSVVVIAALGLSLSLLEWRTKHHYRLDVVCLVVAFITFLSGVFGTISSVSMTFYNVDHREDAAGLSSDEKAEMMRQGLQESFGNLQAGVLFTIPQLVAWAFLRRRQKKEEVNV